MSRSVVIAALGAMAACNADEADPASAPATPAATSTTTRVAPRTITLVTGDRVTLVGDHGVQITPAAGREHITFVQRWHGKDVTVIPSDALPLLHAGKLDRRLFEVSLQLAQGIDKLAYTPVIIKHDTAVTTRARVTSLVPSATRPLASVHAIAARADTAGSLWRALVTTTTSATTLAPGVTKIWLDSLRKPTLDVSVPLIGAPVAWAQGLDGTGVTVAVLDTGIDATHPDLADRVTGEHNFTSDDPVYGEDALDHVGHGTHVASTIAGTGAASAGRYKGVAPGAHLLDAKVCVIDGCLDSWIIAGMEWAADSGAKVINFSVGGRDTPEIDPLEEAVNTLTADKGVLFVVAAGNDGFDRSIESPASADAALAVAAFDKHDQLEDFSSRGPRLGDSAIKPEIAAPGGNIVAARSKDGIFGNPGDLYVELSGTSMATPHVAGSAAILVQQHPDLSPAQLKATLMASAKPNPSVDAFAQGAGRVDVARAIRQSITTEPAAISCGLQSYPHGDDTPITTALHYRNHGATAVTLSLATHALAHDGSPAPAGMFTTSATTVTVPANGDASVDVTCDSRVGSVTGILGGDLTATGPGDVVVETPVGIVLEVESYELTISNTTRTGELADKFGGFTIQDSPMLPPPVDLDTNPQTFRLPRGSYIVASSVTENGSEDTTLVFAPPFELAGDRSVDMDARLGKLADVDVHDAAVQPFSRDVSIYYVLDNPFIGLAVGETVRVQGPAEVFAARVGADVAIPMATFSFGGVWAPRNRNGTFDDSPYAYRLSYFLEHQMPNGFSHDLHRDELARVDWTLGAQAAGDIATIMTVVFGGEGDASTVLLEFSLPLSFHLPARHTEIMNTDHAAIREVDLSLLSSDGDFLGAAGVVAQYTPGQHERQTANIGVFQPRFDAEFAAFASRAGSELTTFFVPVVDSGRNPWSTLDQPTLSLSRDGVNIPMNDNFGFTVPPELGHYRLALDNLSSRANVPSSEIHIAWSFDSAEADVTLPLSTIGFDPILDATSSAPAGFPWLVPLSVAALSGSNAPALHRPTVDVSYDDGTTWQPAFVFHLGGRDQALVIHPRHAQWVSLRAHGQDDAGNAVDETVIRAYRLR